MADQNSFRAQELNLPSDPSTTGLVPIDEWSACITEDPPPLEGDIFIGIDAGGTRAMSAVAAYAPKTGRLRCWGCFPRLPDLAKREKVDGAPYTMMRDRGELHVFGNRTSSLKELLEKVADDLGPDVKIKGRGRRSVQAGANAPTRSVIPVCTSGWNGGGADWARMAWKMLARFRKPCSTENSNRPHPYYSKAQSKNQLSGSTETEIRHWTVGNQIPESMF